MAGRKPYKSRARKRKGAKEKAAREAVEHAKQARPLRAHGRPRAGDEEYNRTDRPIIQGETSSYLTCRIARDHPKILARMKRGEFKSVRAAAIEAGIVKPTFQLRVHVESAAGLIKKHFSSRQVTQLIKELQKKSVTKKVRKKA